MTKQKLSIMNKWNNIISLSFYHSICTSNTKNFLIVIKNNNIATDDDIYQDMSMCMCTDIVIYGLETVKIT